MLILSIFVHSFDILFLNKFAGSSMRAHWNTWGRLSQVWKLEYGIRVMVHACLTGGIGWGCWQMCRQVGVNLLCMHKGFSHLKEEADDHYVIRWCHCHFAFVSEGGLSNEACTSLGALIWSLVVGSFGSTSFLGSHRPSVLATSVLCEEWDYNHTGKYSLFV